jgi:chromosome segregation ATPase
MPTAQLSIYLRDGYGMFPWRSPPQSQLCNPGVDGHLAAGAGATLFAMLDAFFGSSTNKKSQQDELQALIAQAKEERTLLSAMLTQMAGGTSKLAQTSKSLDQVGQKADAALKRLDELGQKVTGYEDRSRGIDQIDKRVAALLEQVHEAQRVSDKITAPDGELQKHRLAVNQLASQALENQATIETLRKERSSFEDLRALLKVSTSEVAKSVESVSALKSELDAIRSTGVQLTSEFARIRDTSREAKDASMTAMDNVKEIEKKLGPLVQLQELSKNTEERLASLNALAEHVAQKAKALEAQKHAVERAVVEANRLNEMVWSMDVQVAKLNEGSKNVARAEETVARMEKLAQATTEQLSLATSAREEWSREFTRLEKESRSLSEYLKGTVERLAVDKKEFDQFDHRLRALSSAVGEAEARMDGVLQKDKNLAVMNQRADELSKSFQTLMAQADEMSRKQGALEALGERLAQVEEMGRRTEAQHEALKQSRQELEQLRGDIAEFHKSHAAAAQLRDKLSADRAALEAFGERATALLSRTPELDSKMDAVLGKMATVEEGTKAATRLGELTAELDAQLTRVGARLQFIEKLEGRINNLHVVTSDVDRKLTEQLARRNEVESLKGLCDTLATQVMDAQQKLDGVAVMQTRLLPITTQVATLQASLEKSEQLAQSVKQEEAVVHDQKARLTELVEQGRSLAAETAERLKQVQSVSDELGRAGSIKEELLNELARVQARQRDAVTQTDAAEDQLKRAETMVKQLEQRRTQLAFSEKKITTFEQRLNDLSRATEGVEQKIKAILERDALVQAVKQEVDTVYKISSRSKADLQFVTDHRSEVADLRGKVENLLGIVSDTDAKIVAIEDRRKMVEEVQTRTNAITNLLDDINVNLEMLGEQRAVIDHVGEKLARLDFMVQEAQNTLRALQREREVAERIEQGIKSLRANSGGRLATA